MLFVLENLPIYYQKKIRFCKKNSGVKFDPGQICVAQMFLKRPHSHKIRFVQLIFMNTQQIKPPEEHSRNDPYQILQKNDFRTIPHGEMAFFKYICKWEN